MSHHSQLLMAQQSKEVNDASVTTSNLTMENMTVTKL